ILSPEILFGILIFLVIFAIIDQIPVFSSTGIKVTLSIVIAILAGGFIPSEWFLPLLNQYTALGVLITLILPFVLIFYFLKSVSPFSSLLHKLVFGAYFIIAFINWLIYNPSLADQKLVRTMYILLLIIDAIMFFASVKIFKAIWEEELKEDVSGWKRMQDLIREGDKAKAEEYANSLPMNAGQRASITKQLAKMK
ncbi:MAG: hypothetical protein GYA14_07760, partial [Ignavibacteria bacterium]|nr:hypothetical protein [Ignavibacteria bacterium]